MRPLSCGMVGVFIFRYAMNEKEIEIGGCITVPSDVSRDEVVDSFIRWVESKGWLFGGGFRELTAEESGYQPAD